MIFRNLNFCKGQVLVPKYVFFYISNCKNFDSQESNSLLRTWPYILYITFVTKRNLRLSYNYLNHFRHYERSMIILRWSQSCICVNIATLTKPPTYRKDIEQWLIIFTILLTRRIQYHWYQILWRKLIFAYDKFRVLGQIIRSFNHCQSA